MPEFTTEDVTLHYEVDGSGPPLVLIAGMMSDSASWGPLLPLLTPHFTVVRPDNRSTGRTRPWDAPAGIDLVARDAMALMRHLGHTRYHVAGHSMGGLVGLDIAGLAPEAVLSLGVLASSRTRAPRTVAVFESLLEIRRQSADPGLWLRALYPWAFRPGFFEDPAHVEAAVAAALAYPHGQSTEAMAHQVAALRRYRPAAALEEIRCPVLVLYAGQDVLIPLPGAADPLAGIADVTIQTIEDAGHSIHWDAPELVAAALVAFALHRNL